MQIFNDFQSVPLAYHNCAVSIGKFDGVHCGHVRIINRLKRHADKLSVPSIIVTFCPHPAAVLRSDSGICPIQTLERKIEIIRQFNIDAIIIINPSKQFLQQSAESFFFGVLCDQLHARVIVCGENFTFGHDRTGTPESIKRYGQSAGTEIDIVDSVQIDGATVSSSIIRKLLKEGQINEANKFLGSPYQITGVVATGDARGRTLGFPTANLEQIETIIPKHGIYATITTINEKQFASTTNIGTSPTFNQNSPRVEIFIHNFEGNLYGKKLNVDLIQKIREIKKFNSKEELIIQMKNDIKQSEKICKEHILERR
ncbi:MAG: bifunctional riboflavin kinase/FAD synthetase [Planctomycetaceae bacterium]|jgi:riboflavin kinase/FMN adenylyltransferase|nr:bifunctional riboflavin kinase/FAD synthetase [Planctomycetaceae bacterium]